MHVARLLGAMRPWFAVSPEDAACASVGTGVEVGLVDPRRAPDLGIRSDG